MELIKQYTKLVTRILIGLLAVILAISLVEFIVLVVRVALTHQAAFNFNGPLDSGSLFISEVQGLIAAILLLTILIELIHALKKDLTLVSHNYVIVITEIALIAIVRHLLVLDVAHMDGLTIIGLSALVLVLGLFYLMATKRMPGFFRKRQEPDQSISSEEDEKSSPET
jgi:uncharacterized membrane protein (DUF373 family)